MEDYFIVYSYAEKRYSLCYFKYIKN